MRLHVTVPVAVDAFHGGDGDVHLFFLSHLHEDHTSGLSPRWRRGRILCSATTRALLLHKFAGFDASLVHALPENEPVTVSLLRDGPSDARATAWAIARQHYYQQEDRSTMTVTLVPANHCPGAVMFVFQGAFGTIVHTGDFRYHPAMVDETVLASIHVDRLYLDNTYCDPRCTMPSREVAAQQAAAIAREHLARGATVVIAVDTLGKEELLVHLAQQCDVPVAVPPRRLEALRLLGLPLAHFTDDYTATRMHCLPKHLVTAAMLEARNREGSPTVAILPSCVQYILGGESPAFSSPHMHVVSYSLHSSFAEMAEFVRRLKPSEIVPIVPDRFADVTRHFRQYISPVPPLWVRNPSSAEPGPRPRPARRSASVCGGLAVALPPTSKRRRPEFEDADDDDDEVIEAPRLVPTAPAPPIEERAVSPTLASLIADARAIAWEDIEHEEAARDENVPEMDSSLVVHKRGLGPINWEALISRLQQRQPQQ